MVNFSRFSVSIILNGGLANSDFAPDVVGPKRAKPDFYKHDAIWLGPESFPITNKELLITPARSPHSNNSNL